VRKCGDYHSVFFVHNLHWEMSLSFTEIQVVFGFIVVLCCSLSDMSLVGVCKYISTESSSFLFSFFSLPFLWHMSSISVWRSLSPYLGGLMGTTKSSFFQSSTSVSLASGEGETVFTCPRLIGIFRVRYH